MQITKNRIWLLTLLMVFSFACEDDDKPMPPAVERIQATFEYSISPNDPNLVLFDNTTDGEGEFKSEWDFGKGEAFVLDQEGVEEVRYEDVGSYTVRLIVTNEAGNTVASEVIEVDVNGVCPDGNCEVQDSGGLKGAANGFEIGMAVRDSRLSGAYDQALTADFNSLTSEYQMKMNILYPSEGNFDFSAADAIVNYAQANDMHVHGHALIWHNATPSWVENFAGTDEEFEAMIKNYITTVVSRYKGKVRSWDVVNEAIEDGSNTLRNSVFRQKMGDDYISKCHQWVKDADPDVLLFYNDYNLTFDSGKQSAMFAIVDDLKTQDLIDGVGAQMHISYNGPSKSQIESVINGTVSRGLLMHISELDIRANPDNDLTALSGDRAEAQKAKFKEVAQIYNAIPAENKFALTVWGLKDDESWLLDFWGVPDWPLMFDAGFNKKRAYEGFLEGIQ